MKSTFYIIQTFSILKLIISPIPSWTFSYSAIDLMTTNPLTYSIYSNSSQNVYLNKKITKNNDGTISVQNTVTYNGNTIDVSFESIESVYTGRKLNCDYIVCPNGKFHPLILENRNKIIPPCFTENSDWNLRCYDHTTSGFFILFYANNGNKNIISTKDSGGSWNDTHQLSGEELYDFRLTTTSQDNNGDYPMVYIAKDWGYLKVFGMKLVLKSDDIHKMTGGQSRQLCKCLTHTQAFFLENSDSFYYITYNETHLESGYSTSTITNWVELTGFSYTHHSDSPFYFVDNIEIKEVNLIRNSQYAYYKIYNINKDKTYHGLIDIKLNKLLYNLEDEITSFIPYSTTEMLAINSNSAYKICIIKNSDNTCSSSCTSGSLILDSEGNKCSTGCDAGKIKLMSEGICINENLCDTNYYTKSTDGTECGLCSYFNPTGDKYKLLNTEGCLGSIPSYSVAYNSELYIYTCKTNYRLDATNKQCVPETCYERCETCNEIGTSVDNQKCLTCKANYKQEGENCIIPPTTIIPEVPTTIITDAPTTVITDAPTTVSIPPTTQIPETEYVGQCKNVRCEKCSAESDKLGLCTKCDEAKYKRVNYTREFSSFFDCKKEESLINKYYKDDITGQYKPCFELCKKCLGPGNATSHNCLECADNYMFRPGPNPTNNCVVYSEYYYISPYNEYKPLDIPQCPEEAKYTIKYENNKIACIFSCKVEKTYNHLYNGNCLKDCPEGTSDNDLICKETDPNKVYVSQEIFYPDTNDTLSIIKTLAEKYAIEFNYTTNHISVYKNREEDFSLLIYKNPGILSQTNLKMPNIDFGECYEEVKKAYNITQDLIVVIADKKVKNNPSTFYLFFHPESGIRLDAGEICKNKSIIVQENLLNMLDEKSEHYELQTALTKQGINIFDINDPYYKDICFDFDNPKKRDMALKDRVKETFVNVTLCDDGCINTGIDLKNNVASCDCKFNDVTNNDLIHENAALEYLVGEFFDLLHSSNILVLKCYKNIFTHFTRSIGGIIIMIILVLCVIFTGLFFSFELTKMKRYIFSLTEKYSSFLANYSHIFNLFPPKRKSLKNKTIKNGLFAFTKDEDNKNNIHKNKKQNSSRIINPNSLSKEYNTKDFIIPSKKENLAKEKDKKEDEEENKEEKYANDFISNGKKIKKFFKNYLSTSPDEMEYDDAIKRDKRTFCGYFLDIIQEKQSLAYTFIASDPINTRMIKFILFLLNIDLYFVVNGLFFSETYISDLYYTDESKETFFSFVPRTIDKVLYTTIVAIFIGYLTDFFFLDEKKIKGIFKREKDNRSILKRSITMIIGEIQKRYIAFIIMVFFILIISLYYILCFNYVYPKTQIEWIKSSIMIIIIIQILSLFKCLFETIFRFLSFKCESEKLYKLSKIFENNS